MTKPSSNQNQATPVREQILQAYRDGKNHYESGIAENPYKGNTLFNDAFMMGWKDAERGCPQDTLREWAADNILRALAPSMALALDTAVNEHEALCAVVEAANNVLCHSARMCELRDKAKAWPLSHEDSEELLSLEKLSKCLLNLQANRP